MEIEVGDYVRFKNGTISKVLGINKDETFDLLCENFTLSSKFVVKHSKNIIDLIEVGDYVNEYKVEEVSAETNEVLLDHNGFGWRTLKDGDKIVTHEQFANVEYKVEEGK